MAETDIEKFEKRNGNVAETEKPSNRSVTDMVAIAVKGGYDPALIEKMMDLQERHERNEAQKAYTMAMAAFKAAPPVIDKDQHVKHSGAEYHHASLSNVTDKINRALSTHGLHASWTTPESEKGITVTCTIKHVLGHSESTSLTAPADNSGSKNAIQSMGSTITYLQRYTLLALTGLAAANGDDDGNAAGTEVIDEDQLSRLRDMIDSTGADEGKFLTFMSVANLEDIPQKNFNKAMQALKDFKKANKK